MLWGHRGETKSGSTGKQKWRLEQVTSEQSFEEEDTPDRRGVTCERDGIVSGGNSKNKGSVQMPPPQSSCPLHLSYLCHYMTCLFIIHLSLDISTIQADLLISILLYPSANNHTQHTVGTQ